jgi:hypothetical protein
VSPSPAILLPVVALAAWTFVMWFWMYATRIPAMMKARMRLDPDAVRGAQMATLPPEVRRKADNYNHLHEQPPVFMVVAVVLFLVGAGGTLDLALAWVYVGIRVVHSLVQATSNIIQIRFACFALSSMVLLALIVRALQALVPLA